MPIPQLLNPNYKRLEVPVKDSDGESSGAGGSDGEVERGWGWLIKQGIKDKMKIGDRD